MFATEIGSMIGFAWVMSWLAVIAFVGRASTGSAMAAQTRTCIRTGVRADKTKALHFAALKQD